MLWLTKITVRPSRTISPTLPRTLLLERQIADRQHFVDDQDVGARWAATAKARRTCMPLE